MNDKQQKPFGDTELGQCIGISILFLTFAGTYWGCVATYFTYFK